MMMMRNVAGIIIICKTHRHHALCTVCLPPLTHLGGNLSTKLIVQILLFGINDRTTSGIVQVKDKVLNGVGEYLVSHRVENR